jgi:hypothetical protein
MPAHRVVEPLDVPNTSALAEPRDRYTLRPVNNDGNPALNMMGGPNSKMFSMPPENPLRLAVDAHTLIRTAIKSLSSV